MSKDKHTRLGSFVKFSELAEDEQVLVSGSWTAAEKAFVPLSKFPVGSMLSAQNEKGEVKTFSGCNVESRFMSCTICAERNAITTAVAEGYTRILKIAVLVKLYQGPGASPCGLCRQVLVHFGKDAVVLQVADTNSSVDRYHGYDLLPAATGVPRAFSELDAERQKIVERVLALQQSAYAPYTKRRQSAVFVATNSEQIRQSIDGVCNENASYGASASAEVNAMHTARTLGFVFAPELFLSVSEPQSFNPVEGESLQILREFGTDISIFLVGPDKSVVESTLVELLPDSFGPQALITS